jgi:hypothetical protein
MKLVVAALIGGLFGGAIGYELASRVFFPKLANGAWQAVQRIDSEQRYAALVSLAALSKLEAGDADAAKSYLAHEIIGYSKSNFDDSLPERRKIQSFIQATVPKSPALQKELAKDQK